MPAPSLSPISFGVQLKPFDIYWASVYFGARKLWWLVALAFGGLLLIVFSSTEHRYNLFSNFAPLFVLAAASILVLPLWTSRSLFKSQRSVQEENRYTFSAEEIEIQSNSASSKTEWSHVYRVTETKSFFFVFTSKFQGWLIPKKAISDEAKIAALRQMFRACVQGKVELRDEAAPATPV